MPAPDSFEPSESDSDSSSGTSTSSSGDDNFERLTDLSWCAQLKWYRLHIWMNFSFKQVCECSCYDFMPTSPECVCCKEIGRTVAKISETMELLLPALPALTECASLHELCKLAFFRCKKEHGSSSSPIPLYTWVFITVHIGYFIPPISWRKYRYIAYCQLTRWRWGGCSEISKWYCLPVPCRKLDILFHHIITQDLIHFLTLD